MPHGIVFKNTYYVFNNNVTCTCFLNLELELNYKK